MALEVDPERRIVSILRDPTGRIECWRMALPGVEVLFSHYQDVYWLSDAPPALDWSYLEHHLSQDYLPGHATGLEGIREILPGEERTYRNGVASDHLRWWPHEIAANPYDRIEDAQAEIRSTAEAAVSAWAGRYERIALDLSGGLDSSIVLGLLKRHAKHPTVLGINWLTPGEDGDERMYAEAAAAMHDAPVLAQEVSSSDFDFSMRLPRRLMRPRARLIQLGYDEVGTDLARRHCHDAYFSGSGGDHLFYDHLPISAASDHLKHFGFDGFLPVATELAKLAKDTVWGIAGAAARRQFSGPEAISTLAHRKNRFLTAKARAAADFDRYTHPWATAAVRSTPPAKLKQILNLIELQRHYNRFGRADVAEEVHPLFSQPVVETCLRVPATWFGIGGIQRGLARRAFADLLPELIRTRRSKGGNSTYWIQHFSNRLPRIRELLLEGRLAQRGLIDRTVVEAALTPLSIAAGGDFLSLNICLPTELWVQQAESDAQEHETLTTQEHLHV